MSKPIFWGLQTRSPRAFMLNSSEHEISIASKKLKYLIIKTFLAFKLSYVVFIMLITVKMTTTVGILTFMSMINFMLS